MKLLGDIKAAARVFKQIRQARKTGAEVEVRHTAEIQVLRSAPSFFCTVEGCALAVFDFEVAEKAQAVFKRLDYDTKMQLAFAPENGEFVERAKFWQDVICKVLPGQQGHRAMKAILVNYIRIKGLRCNTTSCCPSGNGVAAGHI